MKTTEKDVTNKALEIIEANEDYNDAERAIFIAGVQTCLQILQALEEQPVTDEKCEHVTPICYNPDAFCYRSECDQADSCIHHLGRKEKK